MHDIDAECPVDLCASEMIGRSGPAGAILHGLLMDLRIGRELLQRGGRNALPREQHDVLFEQQPDRSEIGAGVIGRVLIQRRCDGVSADGSEQELVAVGWRFGNEIGSDIPAGTGPVVHHDLLSPGLRHANRDRARQ